MTVKAGTRPLVVFYNVLNLACINVYVFYKRKIGDSISRRSFMFHLGAELREAHVHGKTTPPAPVLPPIFNNSFQSSMIAGKQKAKTILN